MFEKIAPGTFMLRTDSRTCSSVYLIEAGGKRLLVDSGDGVLPDFGFAPDICVLTHGHFDHTGGVRPEWKRVLLHPEEFGFGGPYIKLPENAEENPMAPISIGDHRLEFFHTPGHTSGSICMLDRMTGLLFSGDTAFAGRIAGRTDLGGSEAQMRRSLELVAAIPYRLLCPGHGELERRLPGFGAPGPTQGAKRHGELEGKM